MIIGLRLRALDLIDHDIARGEVADMYRNFRRRVCHDPFFITLPGAYRLGSRIIRRPNYTEEEIREIFGGQDLLSDFDQIKPASDGYVRARYIDRDGKEIFDD